MRAAIGLFVTLAALGGVASAQSPGIEKAGLFTPLPAVPDEPLLGIGLKITCSCGGRPFRVEADYCPQARQPVCLCHKGSVYVVCSTSRQ